MTTDRETFHVFLVKPTNYDAGGYPLRWYRSNVPSNSLACMNGIALDAARRQVLGPHTDIVVHAQDDANTIFRPERIIARLRASGGRGLVALVGVQSNQFPRAVDIARPLLSAGIPVCLGGFHVSGSLKMLEQTPPEIAEAAGMGISFFLGEAEGGRFDEVLRDARNGRLKPRYDHLADAPGLEGEPTPFLGIEEVERTYGRYSSFDLGRGCPFLCSFCTIINVQGRTSRFRSADDLERIIRDNRAIGVDRFFLTDDNLARNRNWEACFDRLIELREKEGIVVYLQVQVDVLCHRIPRFIEKAVRAGVDQVFIGMESINPDNLAAIRKKQNRITAYREMLLAWKKYPVVITAGYIIGFPNDTRESILRDVGIIKRELPIDLVYFTNLTPLPGCEDHRDMVRAGTWMDPDLNRYNLNNRVTHHPRMSDAEWDRVYGEAWDHYYTWEHMATVFRRMTAFGSNKRLMTTYMLLFYREYRRIYGCHPLEGGFIRTASRRDRRHGMPLENPLLYYPRHFFGEAFRLARALVTLLRLRRLMQRIWTDPERYEYRDIAMTPPDENDEQSLALFSDTRGGAEAYDRQKQRDAARRIKAAGVEQYPGT